ncbi:MAG TPA: ATP F0F1 synthase subunit B [Caulobacteraceae bacterium]
MSFLVDPQDAHFWIALALVVFIILLWRAKVPRMVTRALDDAGARVQAQLDEAARLRDEARVLLSQITLQREDSERAASEMLRTAQDDAERLRAEAVIELEADIRRRRLLAERRIAIAGAQAAAEVKSAAAEMAADVAQLVLANRIAQTSSDPFVDAGLTTLAQRLS